MFLNHANHDDQVSGDTVELLSKSRILNYDEQKGFIEILPGDEMGYHYLKANLENSVNPISDYFSKNYGVNLEIAEPRGKVKQREPEARSMFSSPTIKEQKDVFIGSLKSRYTFESFVEGESNRFAYAAALGTVKEPGGQLNPLFIRGASGLGKTHLMNAIGNRLIEREPDQNICCLSSEEFTNLVVEYISKKNMEALKRKLRDECDVLMVDDIQFIEERKSTREEFFHTFNVLYNAGKQIIVTSDKEPEEMKNFEDRMISRFMWGMVAEIRPPDIETRAAIIKKKAEERNVKIPQGVVDMISEKVKNNVRELEGVLTKLVVLSKMEGKPIDIRMATEVLNSRPSFQETIDGKREDSVSVEIIKATVEGVFYIRDGQLESPQRTKAVVLARQVAMFLIRKHLDMPYLSIGEEFGNRDHSTVIHAVAKIEKAVKEDKEIVISAIKEVEDRMKYS